MLHRIYPYIIIIIIIRLFLSLNIFRQLSTNTRVYSMPFVVIIALYTNKCTFCIYFRKILCCPCSRTENKFNVYLKIDRDNGLGVPPRTNKTNKSWRSARVLRTLSFKCSSEEIYQLRGTPRNFVNDLNNVLRGFPRKALIFLGVLRKVGNPRGVYCIYHCL